MLREGARFGTQVHRTTCARGHHYVRLLLTCSASLKLTIRCCLCFCDPGSVVVADVAYNVRLDVHVFCEPSFQGSQGPAKKKDHARTEAGCYQRELGPRGLWRADRGYAKSKRIGRSDSKYMCFSDDCQTTYCLGRSSPR
jgi:hypothetical protein